MAGSPPFIKRHSNETNKFLLQIGIAYLVFEYQIILFFLRPNELQGKIKETYFVQNTRLRACSSVG